MSGAAEVVALLQDAGRDALGPIKLAVTRTKAPYGALLADTDIVAAMRSTTELIVALEALHDAADPRALRETLAQQMAETGATQIDCQHHVVSLTAAARKVLVTDAAAVPLEYLTQPAPDKRLLAAALKRGPVAGAELGNGGEQHLRITAKKDTPA